MKYLIALISMFFSINSFSQITDTNLFQTWFLYSVGSSDTEQYSLISEISPNLTPNVTFLPTLDFYGEGACNSFTGTFIVTSIDFLQFSNFASTQIICSPSEFNSFEQGFFSFMQYGGQYSISGTGENMTLVIATPIFENYVFRNSTLHSTDFNLMQTIVYPNPVDSKIYIDLQNHMIDKIEIFNSLGQMVKMINNSFDIIDISNFASGSYLMKIYSEDKTVNKKIIKK